MGAVILMPHDSLFPQDRARGTYAMKVCISPTARLDALEKREMSFSVVPILHRIASVHSLRAHIFKVRFRLYLWISNFSISFSFYD